MVYLAVVMIFFCESSQQKMTMQCHVLHLKFILYLLSYLQGKKGRVEMEGSYELDYDEHLTSS